MIPANSLILRVYNTWWYNFVMLQESCSIQLCRLAHISFSLSHFLFFLSPIVYIIWNIATRHLGTQKTVLSHGSISLLTNDKIILPGPWDSKLSISAFYLDNIARRTGELKNSTISRQNLFLFSQLNVLAT